MIHDPLRMRARALIAGGVFSVLVIAGAGITAVLSPHVTLGDAQLVGVRASGAVYVKVDGRLHPVPNVASGQLILGRHEAIKWIHPKEIDGMELGVELGISPVPEAPRPDRLLPSAAMICDELGQSNIGRAQVTETTLALSVQVSKLPTESAVLAVDTSGQHWLLHQGYRSRVNPEDHVVWRSLEATGTTARPVSDHLISGLPVRADLTTPQIPGEGEKTAYPAPFDKVGALVAVGADRYLATHLGAVQLGSFRAQLIQSAELSADRKVLNAVPSAAAPEWLAHFPEAAPKWFDGTHLCASFDIESKEYGLAAMPAAADTGSAVAFSRADGEGPGPDSYAGARFGTVAVDTGHSFGLVSSTGRFFPVPDQATLEILGSAAEPLKIPWSLMGALEKGPELSRAGALRPVTQQGQ